MRAEDFKICRVRALIGPEKLLRLYADAAKSKPDGKTAEEIIATAIAVEAPSPAFTPEKVQLAKKPPAQRWTS